MCNTVSLHLERAVLLSDELQRASRQLEVNARAVHTLILSIGGEASSARWLTEISEWFGTESRALAFLVDSVAAWPTDMSEIGTRWSSPLLPEHRDSERSLAMARKALFAYRSNRPAIFDAIVSANLDDPVFAQAVLAGVKPETMARHLALWSDPHGPHPDPLFTNLITLWATSARHGLSPMRFADVLDSETGRETGPLLLMPLVVSDSARWSAPELVELLDRVLSGDQYDYLVYGRHGLRADRRVPFLRAVVDHPQAPALALGTLDIQRLLSSPSKPAFDDLLAEMFVRATDPSRSPHSAWAAWQLAEAYTNAGPSRRWKESVEARLSEMVVPHIGLLSGATVPSKWAISIPEPMPMLTDQMLNPDTAEELRRATATWSQHALQAAAQRQAFAEFDDIAESAARLSAVYWEGRRLQALEADEAAAFDRQLLSHAVTIAIALATGPTGASWWTSMSASLAGNEVLSRVSPTSDAERDLLRSLIGNSAAEQRVFELQALLSVLSTSDHHQLLDGVVVPAEALGLDQLLEGSIDHDPDLGRFHAEYAEWVQSLPLDSELRRVLDAAGASFGRHDG